MCYRQKDGEPYPGFYGRASVAEFYGFDTSKLSDLEVELYRRNMPQLEAQRELRGRLQNRDLDPKGWYTLYLLATKDKKIAEEAEAFAILAQEPRTNG